MYTLLLAAVNYNIFDVYLMEDDCPLCNTTANVGECSGHDLLNVKRFPEAYSGVSLTDYAQRFAVVKTLDVNECGLAYFLSLQGNLN